MLTKIKRAQSTAEYAILLALVVAAAMGIQNEVRRAIQARIHDAATALTTGTDGTTTQYEPTETTKTTTAQKSSRETTENYEAEGTDQAWITTKESSSADYGSTVKQ